MKRIHRPRFLGWRRKPRRFNVYLIDDPLGKQYVPPRSALYLIKWAITRGVARAVYVDAWNLPVSAATLVQGAPEEE